MHGNQCFSSSDLPLVTTISLWLPIDSIDKANPNRALFLFKRDQELDQLLEKFWRRELRVEPQAYFAQLKFIKSRLYGND